MASPFDTLTLAQIQERLARPPIAAAVLATSEAAARAASGAAATACAENDAFYAGDHWQNGAGWVGPQPPAGDAESAAVLAEIKKAFVAKNVIKEVVNRHVGGVAGREMAWGLTVRRPLKEGKQPTRAEQALIDEAEAALTEWWDRRKGLKIVQQLVAGLLLHERAALRLFVPAGALQTTDPQSGQPIAPRVPVADLAASLSRIYLSCPAAGQATVLIDDDTQQQAGVYVYTRDGRTYAELSYVDLDSGQTVLRVLGGDTEEQTALDLGGQLWMQEATRAGLISEQIRQLQRQLNLAKTMEGRNVVQGGFLERIILGGQLPGAWVDDPSAPIQADGARKRFVPSPMKIGAGRTNFISGQPIRDAQGAITGYTTPSVVYRDPVSPETFELTADAAYRAILEEAQQLHALIAGDATASGESRKQARADFRSSLLSTKSEIDALVRWLIETVLALAAHFSGQPGRFVGLRASCDCRIDTGPLTGDEQQQILNQVDADLLSRETAMSLLGVEDVDAERARIDAERADRQAAVVAAPPVASIGAQIPTEGVPAPSADTQQP